MPAQGQLVNSLLVRYASGFLIVDYASGGYGRIEGFLALGTIRTPGDAKVVALAQLALRSVPQAAIVAIVQPASLADSPYTGFGLGDTITAPTEAGTPQQVRVHGITVAEDDMGDPIFTPELNTPTQQAEVAYARWLKRMSAGTLGGTVNTAAPGPPNVVAPPTTAVGLAAAQLTLRNFNPPSSLKVNVYAFTKFFANGSPAPNWSIISGSVPFGMTLDQDGSLFGTPYQIGSYSFILQATNGVGTPLQPGAVTITVVA